jgi:drug/metabolite transporter (DMT)-like permease
MPPKKHKKQISTPLNHELYSLFGIGVTLLFSIMSVAMVLANKCVVAIRPQDSASMLLYQVAFTALAMASYAFLYKPDSFNKRQMLLWTPCAVLFTCNIVTSAMALEYITVPTFSVLRNVQPFISTLLGVYLVPRLNTSIPSEPTSFFKLYALLLILIGTAIYAWKDVEFELNGYLWVLGHISSMSLYVSLVKSKDAGSDALPSSTKSLYVSIVQQQHHQPAHSL